MQRNGASPGGPAISAAKKRRLAMLDESLQTTVKPQQQQQPLAGARQPGRPDARAATSGRAAAAIMASPASAALDAPHVKDGDFPYNVLGEAVLDGSLSSALAQAKAAAQAAAAASGAAFGGPAAAPSSRRGSSRRATRTVTSAAAAAAAAAAAGGDSVAADVLAELVATNPRASSSDLRAVLSQRLQDRSVLLDNPTAALNAKKMFARRTSSYSAKLRSNTEVKRRAVTVTATTAQLAAEGKSKGPAPSFETMLRVHELWIQYTQGLIRNLPGGAAASGAAAAAAAAAKVADLHGARMTVVQHRNPQLVGVSGVVLRRSSVALHLATPGDRVKVVPLKGCVAQYAINGIVLQLTG